MGLLLGACGGMACVRPFPFSFAQALNAEKAGAFWGPDPSTPPVITKDELAARVTGTVYARVTGAVDASVWVGHPTSQDLMLC